MPIYMGALKKNKSELLFMKVGKNISEIGCSVFWIRISGRRNTI
jgi:hypothetical protein